MAEPGDVRQQVLEMLMEKVAADRFPSATMMDMIESLAGPDDVEEYVAILLSKLRDDQFPSPSMLRRVLALAQ